MDDFLQSTDTRRAECRRVACALSVALSLACAAAPPAWAQASEGASHALESRLVFLPAIGGGGGSQFKALCNGDEQLAGVELRAGDDIDAIRPVCVTAFIDGAGVRGVGAATLTTDTGLVCTRDDLFCDTRAAGYAFNKRDYAVAPGWYGGIGGHIERLLCPGSRPIVLGMDIRAEGVDTISVNNIHLFCGQPAVDQVADANPSNIFDAPANDQARERTGSLRCPAGLVAVGLHGRAGIWLDALGLACDLPRVKKYLALGRVETTGAADGPRPSLCEAARSARERNSPAAPALERQCEASKPPPVLLGRVGVPADAPRPGLCDAAKSARARNSPAAPGLERQCQAFLEKQARDQAAKPGEEPAPRP